MFSGLEQVGNKKVSPDDFVREIDYVNKALTGKNKEMVIHHLKDFLTGQGNISHKRTLLHKTMSKIDPEKADKLLDSVARLVHTVAVVLTDETLELTPEERASIMTNINFVPETPDPRSEEEKKSLENSYFYRLPRDVLRSVIVPYVTGGKSDAHAIEQTTLTQAYPNDSRIINQGTLLDLRNFSTEKEFVAALDKHGSNITELNLHNFAGIKGKATSIIESFLYSITLKKCPNLKKLNVAYCPTEFFNVHDLIPTGPTGFFDVRDLIPTENVKIEELSISNSKPSFDRRDLFDGFTPLKNLQVIKLDNISDPGEAFFNNLLSLPRLRSLTLLSISSQKSPLSFIDSLSKHSHSTLESLTLSGVFPLRILEINLPNLTTLKLSGAVNVEVLMKMAESNNFPNLKVLTIVRDDLYTVELGNIDKPFRLSEEQKTQIMEAFYKKGIMVEFPEAPIR